MPQIAHIDGGEDLALAEAAAGIGQEQSIAMLKQGAEQGSHYHPNQNVR
jgi:hypothetical protein